ncbi:MAG: helix-turn-helix domain-containing protein [Myxococcota bacterium]
MTDSPASGEAFAARLRALMERRDLNKSDLQRATGARWQTVDEWTKGTWPSTEYARKLAEVLNVSLDELLGIAEGQDPPYPAWHQFLRTPEGRSASAAERRALKSIAWPEGKEPTISSYLVGLQMVRSTVERDTLA